MPVQSILVSFSSEFRHASYTPAKSDVLIGIRVDKYMIFGYELHTTS